MLTELVRFALPVGMHKYPYTRVIVLSVLGFAGCGGGDFPVDAPPTEASAVAGAAATQATAPGGFLTTATPVVANESASSSDPSLVMGRRHIAAKRLGAAACEPGLTRASPGPHRQRRQC